ncbi:MAG: hypothetical protein ACI4PX_01950 [Ruminococcus sp.]
MEDYKISKNPITGDLMWLFTNSQNDSQLVRKFIKENYHGNYTISFFDALSKRTLEITNPTSEIVDAIEEIVCTVSNSEHTFVNFVGINSLSKSYVIGMEFTHGNFHLPCICKYEKGKLIKI